jgi:hypothetical protein
LGEEKMVGSEICQPDTALRGIRVLASESAAVNEREKRKSAFLKFPWQAFRMLSYYKWYMTTTDAWHSGSDRFGVP